MEQIEHTKECDKCHRLMTVMSDPFVMYMINTLSHYCNIMREIAPEKELLKIIKRKIRTNASIAPTLETVSLLCMLAHEYSEPTIDSKEIN